ncbi:hypothetical protein Ahy_A06g028041 isoform A [Arachis hypogaea]|uniref:HAT C-terminal dimerisation domain-containing protein n=1 Tax=Arachis hypogaea TaxID=3818 RepID=A0A445CQ95_ARAHY|nr:hypothetical protein Ahy_A06g028041 isoform A [Arachis hypogaea]
MVSKMQRKYDKYWGTPNVINMLLLIAIVLNTCHKLDFVNWILNEPFGVEKGGELKSKLFTCLNSLYNHYQGKEDESQSNQDAKSELDKYLKEDCEPRNKSAELDILGWWKGNSTRFPILARMAREVLAIPVSTVASESAFSTGGSIIDPYRSSLTPYMVEALVCTQHWVIDDPFGLIENFEEIEKAEQGNILFFLIACLLQIVSFL